MTNNNDLIPRGDVVELLTMVGIIGGIDGDPLTDMIAAIPAAPMGVKVELAYEHALQDALKQIASLGTGKSEDIEIGHEEAFRAVEKHLSDWKSGKPAALTPQPAPELGDALENVAAALWRAEAVDSGTPKSVIDGRTREAFKDQSEELRRRWEKFASAALAALKGGAE